MNFYLIYISHTQPSCVQNNKIKCESESVRGDLFYWGEFMHGMAYGWGLRGGGGAVVGVSVGFWRLSGRISVIWASHLPPLCLSRSTEIQRERLTNSVKRNIPKRSSQERTGEDTVCRQHGTGEGAAALLLALQEPERPGERPRKGAGSGAALHHIINRPRRGLPGAYTEVLQL